MHTSTELPWFRRLHWQIVIAMVLGCLAGLGLGAKAVLWFGWLGSLFVKLLKMIIVPLIMTSIISGVASIGGGRDLGRMFSKTLGYYVLSSALAIFAGLLAVNLIRPGVGADFAGAESSALPELAAPSSVSTMLLDMIPDNPIGAAASGNMLAVIVFCIFFGMALAGLPEEPRSRLLGFFEAGFQAMMRLTSGIIMLLPLGVFGLIARLVGATGFASFKALAMYMLTITASLTVHLFITLPLLLMLLGKINPKVHFKNMAEAMLMAFSTSSSAATLPVTIDNVENKVGVSNRVSSFVLPMGATVNMDGTALYECAGVLFIAQALGADLGIIAQLTVVLTALLASIGAAAVPSAGLVIIFIVLDSVGLHGPEVDAMVGAMLAIDRPLDMYRTTVNIFSDSCGAAIIAKSEGEKGIDVDSD